MIQKIPQKRIEGQEKASLYLTFDDGPFEKTTPYLLEMMEQSNIQGTFFFVALKAKGQSALLRRILSKGHKIGNHSLDHKYSPFFKGRKYIRHWVKESEDILTDLMGEKTIGFRPPNGIHTPELHWALKELKIPLILWNKRYFDGLISLTQKRIDKKGFSFSPGSIVLLHEKEDFSENKNKVHYKAIQYLFQNVKGIYQLQALERPIKDIK